MGATIPTIQPPPQPASARLPRQALASIGAAIRTATLGRIPKRLAHSHHSGLPVGAASQVKFTLQSKNDLYVNFEAAIFRDEGDIMRLSYRADHPLTAELQEQMTRLSASTKAKASI
jgi:hypothetical protein